jgi:NIMA (never in mitosis gene a)-related kinase
LQIAEALEHMHDKNITHRDLKSENVLVANENKFMIGDFGLSKILTTDSKMTKAHVGTLLYMSP